MFGKFYPEGAILFNENDPGEEMYYLQDGAVRLVAGRADSRREKTLGRGDILGEEALLQRSTRTAMAEVTCDSRLLVIDASNLEKVARNGPELAAAIMTELMKKLDEAWESMRLWQDRFFLRKIEVFFRGAESSRGWKVDEISAETDIEEEGVRRVLAALVEGGGLSREGEAFRLKDLSSLERLAAEQP